MEDEITVGKLSILNSVLGDAVWIPPSFWEPGWLSAYKGHFGQGATIIAGTGALVAGPTLAPFTVNTLGLNLHTGIQNIIGAKLSVGTDTSVGVAHVEAAALTSNMSGLNFTTTKKEMTAAPSRPAAAFLFKIFGVTTVFGSLKKNGIEVRTMLNHSDIRLKKKVRPLNSEESLNKILKLQGVSFHWKKEKVPTLAKRYPKNIGLIAQQVEGVVPEVMDTDTITIKGGDDKKMEIKTLQYEKLTALLIEGMKEQQKQIDSLKARVATLEAA